MALRYHADYRQFQTAKIIKSVMANPAKPGEAIQSLTPQLGIAAALQTSR